mgnify:CR=1 FL=1
MAQNPVVTFTMENGDVMKAELYPEIAPASVNNFISLIQKNFYDGLIFHRVIRGFMIQGGDPEGTGCGGPGYSIKGEIAQEIVMRGKIWNFHRYRLSATRKIRPPFIFCKSLAFTGSVYGVSFTRLQEPSSGVPA